MTRVVACCVQHVYRTSALARGNDHQRAARDRGDHSLTESAGASTKGFSIVDLFENIIGVDIDGDCDKGQGYGLVDGLENVLGVDIDGDGAKGQGYGLVDGLETVIARWPFVDARERGFQRGARARCMLAHFCLCALPPR